MILKLYNFLHIILWPLVNILIALRLKKGKETAESIKAKKAIFSISRPKGKLVWFHAASVGEAISLIPLVNAIAKLDDTNVLVTSGTLTSAKILKPRLPANAFHHPLPYDRPSYIRKFLAHFKPNVFMIIESEIWPNLITLVKESNIPLFLGSARISPKSKLQWFYYSLFLKSFFQEFDLIIPQDSYTETAIKKLVSSDRVTKIGNLKTIGDPLPFEQSELEKLQTKLSKRKIFLASSTHKGEEKLIASCHHKLKQKFPTLLTIIVPRHPDRSVEIAELLAENKLSVSVRSRQAEITDITDIYLADTLGELGLFYNLVDFAFIGGSLTNQGGHNPLEAARSDCATIHGPHIQNFKDIYQEFTSNNATVKIENILQLQKQVTEFLLTPDKTQEIVKNSQKVISNKQSTLTDYIKIIKSGIHPN